MEKSTLQLGTNELHQRHSVLIEPGLRPRARVMDQHICDRWLMDGLLTLREHRAAEYLLGQAAISGSFARSMNWWSDRTSGGERNHVPFGVIPFGKSLRCVQDSHGAWHSYVVWRVIVYDWDVSKNEFNITCFKDSMDTVSLQRMSFDRNPLRYLNDVSASSNLREKKGRQMPPKGGGDDQMQRTLKP